MKVLFVVALVFVVAVGSMLFLPTTGASSDRVVVEKEPERPPTITKRMLPEVQQPKLDLKKREATVYLAFKPGDLLLLTPEAFRQLDTAGRAFEKAYKNVENRLKWVIEIAGHADGVEATDNKMVLSRERAESVRQYLLEKYELPSTLVMTVGYGDTKPISTNHTTAGQAKNRRVEFKVRKATAIDRGMYAYERGDYTLAFMEFRAFAENGNNVVQAYLAQMYFEGKGIPQDYVYAHMWANISSAQGFEKAGALRDAIANKMTQGQLAEAQKLAREWKPKKPEQ
jgi:outer membrane protein OmpA-like peptidoglycan-associated protein